jgi:hypothetical protein
MQLFTNSFLIKDQILEIIDIKKYNTTLYPKRSRTLNLKAFFIHLLVDFFIILASAISALGTRDRNNSFTYNSNSS